MMRRSATLPPSGGARRTADQRADAPAHASPDEVAKFDAIAGHWWDVDGPMAPLHKMQAARLDFILDQIAGHFGRDPAQPRPLSGLRALDLGCGAGLLSEPLHRLGAEIVGLDASSGAIEAARAHAAAMGLEIDYRAGAVEDLAGSIDGGAVAGFDVVVSFEVVEHVSDVDGFLHALAMCLRPGGLALLSTLSQTPQSAFFGVFVAERVLGWLPAGTHDWRKFVGPDALAGRLRGAGLTPVDRIGFVYDPIADRFRLSRRDLSINYAVAAVKP